MMVGYVFFAFPDDYSWWFCDVLFTLKKIHPLTETSFIKLNISIL